MSNEKIPGTRSIAQRIVNAENEFIQLVKEKGFTQAEAEKIMRVYLALKVAKLDPVLGRISVKHGIYWELEPLRNAAKYELPIKSGRRKNPSSIASVLYARKGKGPLLWFDGKKFTNNDRPKPFGSTARGHAYGMMLRRKYALLRQYRMWMGPITQRSLARRHNPESREAGLDKATRLLENFSGHPVRRTVRVRPNSPQRTGLIFGEMDYVDYIAKREGINGGKLTRYRHAFSKGSRPLLASTSDGKQLYIVGGRYEFTEAGVEDR